MFGYITINPAQLTEEERARYRSCYCGLCRSLRDSCGMWGRTVLSNDMTFLSILLNSLYEPEEEVRGERCPAHPLTVRESGASVMTGFAADMNLLLGWYKAKDDLQDGSSPAARMTEKRLAPFIPAIEEKYPAQCTGVREALSEFNALEKEHCQEIDRLCDLSGRMLASVFAPKEDEWAALLRRTGFGLGRFVLFMDAYEDLKDDLKHGRFNPLQSVSAQPDFESFCRDTLQLLIAEATEAFEFLPLEKDLSILRNVLYSGVWTRWTQLHTKEVKGLNKADDE